MTRRAVAAFAAEFLAACLIGWGTFQFLTAIGPRPWVTPKYGSWVQ